MTHHHSKIDEAMPGDRIEFENNVVLALWERQPDKNVYTLVDGAGRLYAYTPKS